MMLSSSARSGKGFGSCSLIGLLGSMLHSSYIVLILLLLNFVYAFSICCLQKLYNLVKEFPVPQDHKDTPIPYVFLPIISALKYEKVLFIEADRRSLSHFFVRAIKNTSQTRKSPPSKNKNLSPTKASSQKSNVDQDNILRIISGEGKLFLVEEHIR